MSVGCTLTVDDGVATITIDSPANRNAISRVVVEDLRDHLRTTAADVATRVVVLTATGTVFSSGWDVAAEGPEEGLATDAIFVEALEAIRLGDKPVVARVGGHVAGGAIGLVAVCDLSVAALGSRFSFGEVRLGLAPTTAAVHCVPKLREADALELFLTAARIDAVRAAEIGLINRAVPPEQLDASVAELVDALRRGGPLALAACKRLARARPATIEDAYALAAELNQSLVGSPEATEGIAAFTERRPPRWS